LPCEKIILSTDGLATLANVLDRVNIDVERLGEAALSQTAAVPMVWEIFTLWRNVDGADDGKTYEQLIELLRPDRTSAFSISITINVEPGHINIRSTGKVGAFPVGVAGTAWLRLFLKDAGENENALMAEYPILVTHDTQAQVQKDVQKTLGVQQTI